MASLPKPEMPVASVHHRTPSDARKVVPTRNLSMEIIKHLVYVCGHAKQRLKGYDDESSD